MLVHVGRLHQDVHRAVEVLVHIGGLVNAPHGTLEQLRAHIGGRGTAARETLEMLVHIGGLDRAAHRGLTEPWGCWYDSAHRRSC